jgi:hypothetical protein
LSVVVLIVVVLNVTAPSFFISFEVLVEREEKAIKFGIPWACTIKLFTDTMEENQL